MWSNHHWENERSVQGHKGLIRLLVDIFFFLLYPVRVGIEAQEMDFHIWTQLWVLQHF